ncbi:MAG: sigma-54-dependent Fis family transcriptional regulator [Acidobacteria bacterium]|nr:sigma-54-dependent Fis family transcriptional regulator [Acidobacteriota bacterium]
MAKQTVLIVDDENLIRWSLKQKLGSWGYQTAEATNGHEAMARFQLDNPDLITLDMRMPDMSGLEVLQQIRESDPSVPVIMITAYGVIDDAVRALKAGAYDFLEKPINFDKLQNLMKNALETSRLKTEVERTLKTRKTEFSFQNIVGQSKAMTQVMELVLKIARSGASTVLIQGESGTGKDLIAHALHYESSRREAPFFAINCAAIPETLIETEMFGHEKGAFTDARVSKKGIFELADGGTVFLDEVSEMAFGLQAKLLRVLEDQTFRRVGGSKTVTVDVRLIASTNRNLEEAVREGKFREDLYYRLSVIPIYLAPLRQRKSDIPLLVDHFLRHYNEKFRKQVRGVSPEANKVLMDYPWPGNVRELRNAIERAMILDDKGIVDVNDLPIRIAEKTPVSVTGSANGGMKVQLPHEGTALEGVEKELIRQALVLAHGNKSRAARLLQISRDTLRYKIKKFSLF